MKRILSLLSLAMLAASFFANAQTPVINPATITPFVMSSGIIDYNAPQVPAYFGRATDNSGGTYKLYLSTWASTTGVARLLYREEGPGIFDPNTNNVPITSIPNIRTMGVGMLENNGNYYVVVVYDSGANTANVVNMGMLTYTYTPGAFLPISAPPISAMPLSSTPVSRRNPHVDFQQVNNKGMLTYTDSSTGQVYARAIYIDPGSGLPTVSGEKLLGGSVTTYHHDVALSSSGNLVYVITQQNPTDVLIRRYNYSAVATSGSGTVGGPIDATTTMPAAYSYDMLAIDCPDNQVDDITYAFIAGTPHRIWGGGRQAGTLYGTELSQSSGITAYKNSNYNVVFTENGNCVRYGWFTGTAGIVDPMYIGTFRYPANPSLNPPLNTFDKINNTLYAVEHTSLAFAKQNTIHELYCAYGLEQTAYGGGPYFIFGKAVPWGNTAFRAQAPVAIADELSLYPNPAQSVVAINGTGLWAKDLGLKVYDIAGRQVFSASGSPSILANSVNADFSKWQPGIYIFDFSDKEQGVKKSIRLVKQ